MTDLNEQLPVNVKNITGKWAYGEASQNAEKMMTMLRQFDLFAVNTAFQSKRSSSNATFIKTTTATERYESSMDLSFLSGREVSIRYHGKSIKGTVKNPDHSDSPDTENKKWNVTFEGGYSTKCSEKWILNHTAKTKLKRKRVQKQIDYIFVSNRWRSSVTDVKVRWGPSIHRNIRGKDDHALVMCQWRWRLREMEEKAGVDWSVLRASSSSSAFQGLNPEAADIIMRNVDRKYPVTAADTEEMNSVSPPSPLSAPAVLIPTHANEVDIPNPEHEFVRDNHLKNGDLPLTHSPNALESTSSAIDESGRANVNQTKPSKRGKDMMVEGRIAQYHQCSNPPDGVRGRDPSLADDGRSEESRV